MFNNQIVNALTIIFIFWLASYAITFLIGLIGKVAGKTKTNLDDIIIQAVKLPIRYLAIIIGFYLALKDFGWTWLVQGKEFGIADISLAMAALLLAFMVSRILKTIFDWYGQKKETRISQTMFVFLRKIISVLVYLLATLIVFSQLGIEITPMLAALGVAGLAIALGLQSTLENLFAALFIVMDKSININDWIKLEDGTKAFIDDISWRSVRIRTLSGNTVIVPNSTFVSEKIWSYDYPEKAFFTSIRIGISYDSDLEKAEYVAIQAAEKIIKSEKVSTQENNPIVRYKELADSAINMALIIKIDRAKDEGRIKHALIKEVVKQFRDNNIEIPFPQLVLHKNS